MIQFTQLEFMPKGLKMKSLIVAAFSSVALVSAAVAGEAANAYVSIDAPGAKNQGGVDFAVKGDTDAVSVAVKPQPGWELTSSPVVVIPKGTAGKWSARSFYGESGSDGEICVPTTSVSTNHVHAPKIDVNLHVNHGNGKVGDDAVAKGNGNGNGNGDKDRGGIINIGASLKSFSPGLHRILKVHDTCPGGKSNVHTEDKTDIDIAPDTFKWTWSVGGQSGTAAGSALLVSGIQLPRGKYTVKVTLTATCSKCAACTATASASKEINIGNGVIK
jgi:hypothetical protein